MLEGGHGNRYVPVDVSESAIQESAERLAEEYPALEVHGIVGDFEHHLDRVPRNDHRRLVAFLGGTIGNFDPDERQALLGTLQAELGPEDRLLVGTDLVKDRSRLEAAYNDTAGVTAEFNRNVLNVINSNLDGELDPERFEHIALYDEREEWIEMRLRAKDPHTARIGALDLDVSFDEGEHIRTEISCKFTAARMLDELAAAGLELHGWFTDPERLFALSLAGPARGS
jgi:L-histidine N-alpha-methyltransferase